MKRMTRQAATVAFACWSAVGAAPLGTRSSLDGWPSQTRYLSNDAPFVVFGVTPTSVDNDAQRVRLTFMATDRLEQVLVFPFIRAAPGAATQMAVQVSCGPRDVGSWDCVVPVAELLSKLENGAGELGLRIEAHGDLRAPAQHSTVIITLPVRRSPGAAG